jgi:small-conductance mechanosensitive channel
MASDSLSPLSEAQEVADERIRGELQAIYDRVSTLQGIQVRVSAGVVSLVGEVSDGQAAERAAELARTRADVVFVDDGELRTPTAAARLEDVGGRLQDKWRDFVFMLPLFGVAALLVAFFWGLAWLVGRVRLGRLSSDRSPFLASMVERLLQFALVLIGLVAALELLDATALVGAVVGTAGLAGLALGFAFKDIAENYLAGIILSLRNPFSKNDLILVGAHEGKVVRLAGRETILMTMEGNHVQIPNATVFREPIINFTRNPLRQFRVVVGVAPDTALSEALDLGVAVLRRMQGVIDEPPPEGLVWELGDSTTTVRFLGWVDQRKADFLRVRSEAIRLVKAGLEEGGIELPEPQYRLRLSDHVGVPLSPAASPAPSAPTPMVVTPAVQPQRYVSVDRTLDEQIEAERRGAEEEDLLSAGSETGGSVIERSGKGRPETGGGA